MVRHDFICEVCNSNFEAVISIKHIDACKASGEPTSALCACGGRGVITFKVAPGGQSPLVDNRRYNNGQGYYDVGLGRVIRSRREHAAVMRQMGVHALPSMKRDRFEEYCHNSSQHEEIKLSEDEVAAEIERTVGEINATGKPYDPPPPPEGFAKEENIKHVLKED